MEFPRPMPPVEFRKRLREEAEQWQQAGWIDTQFYEQLAMRYRFAHLEAEASHWLTGILLTVGGVLLGLAGIALVAAHWQVWSRLVKLGMLVGFWVSVNGMGYYLWRSPSTQAPHLPHQPRTFPLRSLGRQRMGEGLLIGGALALGANLLLLGQMIDSGGLRSGLFLTWGLGIVPMAYMLRLESLGVLALLLLVGGYGFHMLENVGQTTGVLHLLAVHFPLVVALGFTPLAYRCRSKAVFTTGAVACLISLGWTLAPLMGVGSMGGAVTMVLAVVLPPALLWSFGQGAWQWSPTHHPALTQSDPFREQARGVALYFLAGALYLTSFYEFWQWPGPSANLPFALHHLWRWLDLAFFSLVTILGWQQVRRELQRSEIGQPRLITSLTMAVMLSIMSGLLYCHWAWLPLAGFGPVGMNILLFLLAIAFLRDGLVLGQRHLFGGGLILLGVGILSRTLEYKSPILLQAMVLLICGTGLIGMGHWFERRRAATRTERVLLESLPSIPNR